VVEGDGAGDEVEPRVREGKRLSGSHLEPDVRPLTETRPCGIDHGGRRVDAHQVDRGWKAVGECPQQRAGAAADVEDGRRSGHHLERRIGRSGHDTSVKLGAPAVLVGQCSAIEAAYIA
jgi:hypothetical protein